MPSFGGRILRTTAEVTLGYPELAVAGRLMGASVPLATVAALEALLGAAIALAGRSAHVLPLAAATGSYLLLLAGFSVVGTPIFWYRTVLPALVPLVALVATHLDRARPPWLRRTLVALGLVPIVVWGWLWVSLLAGYPKEPWRSIAGELGTRFRPGSIVAFYPFYAAGPIRYYVDLPEESVVKLPVRLDASEAASAIEQNLRRTTGEGQRAVFVVARRDQRTARHSDAFRALKVELEARIGRRVHQRPRVGGLSLLEYEVGVKSGN
jgi:hypothetical protein